MDESLAGFRDDLYGYGMCLWTMLTGQCPQEFLWDTLVQKVNTPWFARSARIQQERWHCHATQRRHCSLAFCNPHVRLRLQVTHILCGGELLYCRDAYRRAVPQDNLMLRHLVLYITVSSGRRQDPHLGPGPLQGSRLMIYHNTAFHLRSLLRHATCLAANIHKTHQHLLYVYVLDERAICN